MSAVYGLQGKVALVTGAGGERGFGRAIANRLAREGADVAVNDVAPNPYGGGAGGWGGIEAVAGEIAAAGRGALALVGDVANAADVDRMTRETIARFGRLDILVCNAGSRPGPDRVPLVDLAEEAFDEVQRVNVRGTFLCARAAARHMIERGGGKIIIIASTAGKRGMPRYAAYTASKFALVGFTQSVAHELGPHGVNVNAICPGLAETERAAFIADAVRPASETGEAHLRRMVAERAAANPMGRIAETDDVARMAAFLASSESDYLTGLAVSVSGGDVMH